jgi:hypothetical protein
MRASCWCWNERRYSRILMQEVVQSVNIMIGILLGGVSWSIYYIMRLAYLEMNDERQNTRGSEG